MKTATRSWMMCATFAISASACVTDPPELDDEAAALMRGGGGVPCFGKLDADRFGAAVVVADFDGDGQLDLAIGAPHDEDRRANPFGAVYVFRREGTAYLPWRRLTSDSLGVPGSWDFGYRLAAVDLDQDGRAELMIARPEIRGLLGSSRVGDVLVTSADGDGDQFVLRQTLAPRGAPADHMLAAFGSAMVVADFNGDGRPDLAVGAPGEKDSWTGQAWRRGRVYLYTGQAGQLTLAGHRSAAAFGPAAEHNGHFGTALAAGDFDDNGYDDLAIGSPDEWTDEGAVYLYTSRASNLVVPVAKYVGRTVVDQPHGEPTFGSALAAADFDGNGKVDLAVGAPSADRAGYLESGSVVLYRWGTWSLGHWTSVGMPIPGHGQGRWLAAADFDGNGAADLAVGAAAVGAMGDLAVWRGRVGNSPLLGKTYDQVGLLGAAGRDVDGDGKAELLVGQTSSRVLIGAGRSVWMPALDVALDEQAAGCAPSWASAPTLTVDRARTTELVIRATSSTPVTSLEIQEGENGRSWGGPSSPLIATHSGLDPQSEHCYNAWALAQGGEIPSDPTLACFETREPISPPQISMIGRTTSSLTVRVTASAQAGQLRIQREGGAPAETVDGTTVTRTFSGLAEAAEYCFVASWYHSIRDEWSDERRSCFHVLGDTKLTLNPLGSADWLYYQGTWGEIDDARPVHVDFATSSPGYKLRFVKIGYSTHDCGNSDAYIELEYGGELTTDQISELFDGRPIGVPYYFVACWAGGTPVPEWVRIDIEWEVI